MLYLNKAGDKMNTKMILNEYYDKMNCNKYIGIKEYNQFLDKLYNKYRNEIINNKDLQLLFNQENENLEKHNQEYIEEALKQEKEYFDNMFKNIDDNIILDVEQRKAILCDEDSSLIIAGAGSGKTTTMAAKVKYLVERKHIDPSKIVVISYTNKATDELEDRIKYDFDLPVDIMTFHSLGIKIVRKIIKDKPIKPLVGKEQKEIIVNYFKEILFKDKDLLLRYINAFNKYSEINRRIFSKGFIENSFKFDTFEDYFKDYKRRKQEINKDNLDEIIKNYEDRFLKFDKPQTLKGEQTKSIGEARIANYLFKHGIDYKYEEPYPERIDLERTYLPDFTIEIKGIPVYIEYYGLSNYIGENNTLSEKEKKKYEYIRNKKREFHKLKNNNYIELDYNNETNENYIHVLIKELTKRGVSLNKISNEKLYDAILNTNEEAEIFGFVDFALETIESIKSSLDRNKINKKINEHINSLNLTIEEQNELIEESNLIIKLYNYYQSKTIQKNQIDFADMIYYANKYLLTLNTNNNILDYEYIIIDEYQDISINRYKLARNLSLMSNAKIVSVGDDWQTIFSFAGSRIDLFYDYEKLFSGAKNLVINNTYRNSQQLINLAGCFITKNPYQIKKNLKSGKTRNAPIKIVPYDDNEFEILGKIIEKIHRENPNDKIMILSRKNRTLTSLKHNALFEEGLNERIKYKKCPNAYIEAMSIHKSKGLGADQVIILNVTNKNFPEEARKTFWIKNLFDDHEFVEEFPDAEERRVFYVALTRTKKDVYLLTPREKSKESPFVKELLESEI